MPAVSGEERSPSQPSEPESNGSGEAPADPAEVERREAEQSASAGGNPNELAEWINKSNTDKLSTNLPGFIPAKEALPVTADKRTALKRMEENQVEMLPVVDGSWHLIGVVDRAQLTTSLLREILATLDTGK